MGVEHLFGGNYQEISKTTHLLFDDMIHKAKIIVDEEGTTAAAATGVVSRGFSFKKVPDFICDHPFAYVIYDKSFDEVLFAGVYRG